MELSSNKVFLEKSPGYREADLLDCFNRLLISSIPTTNLNSLNVLLKPNLISARMGTLPCTEGRFIAAAAKWFLEHNARVSVGDSPAFGTAAGVLRRIGIADELRRLSVPIADFTRVRHVTLPSGLRAGMAASALECDLLVNMPRVKAHAQFRVTMGVKNLFGCLAGMRKPLWHMVHGGREGRFADHLVEFLAVLPSGVTLVDGITAMHRTGPMGGQSFPLGITACSSNPVAVDRALLAVLSIAPERSPLMQACSAMGINGIELAGLEFPLHCPAELAVNSFAVPGALHPVRFSLSRFIRGNFRRILLKLGPLS
ncbi:MAG TPA: DUF362 domain-containing protein [Desulfobacteraceae bacterium]|nr:DUF362 domain-containing protein [Desulfobacteraceae bacterium]